ncbi:hypothetical protein [Arthrobacter flavus]|uniref:Uncharacterized protein n=1 Tax=Arthrobacter flavus TaxID=95172 RepID=A0ABW4Q3K0_9MICC
MSLSSDHFLSRLSISGRAIIEATGGQSFEAVTTVRHSSKSHTHHPWVAKTLQLPRELPAQQHKDSSKKEKILPAATTGTGGPLSPEHLSEPAVFTF